MKNSVACFAAAVGFLFAGPPAAHAAKNMTGLWSWNGYKIECRQGGDHGLSCKVVEGPKNIGTEMIQSTPYEKDSHFYCDLKHPESKELFTVEMKNRSADRWYIVGCTKKSGGLCTHGSFNRVK